MQREWGRVNPLAGALAGTGSVVHGRACHEDLPFAPSPVESIDAPLRFTPLCLETRAGAVIRAQPQRRPFASQSRIQTGPK